MKNQDELTPYFTPKAGTPGTDEKFQAFTVKSMDTDTRQITGVASAEIVDRDGEIVTIAALKAAMKNYMQNPVILAGHSHRLDDGRSPVIGKVVAYEFKGKQLFITVAFANSSLATEYWQLYRDKFQRAFSIGFRVFKSHEETRDNKRVRIIDEIELYEISCVAVPANPAALAKGKTWMQRTRVKNEKQKILNNPDAFEKLLDRFEAFSSEYGDPFGNIPDDSGLWSQFSEAEKAILNELEQEGLEFASEIAACEPIEGGADDDEGDVVKTMTGDFESPEDDFEISGHEPDYGVVFV